MPVRPRPLPPELGSTFTTAAALAAGVSPRRLRATDLALPFRGVRTVRAESPRIGPDGPFALDVAQRERVAELARAYAEVMPAHALFAARTAAALWGLPIVHGADLEVAAIDPHRAPRRAGIDGRKIRPALVSIRELDGLRLSSPASTWAMLGETCSVRDLVVVGDAAVRVPRNRHGDPRPDRALATVAHLRAAIDAGPRRGVQRLRDALLSIRVGSASPLETEYRLDAAAEGLPDPELDVEIRDGAGRLLGISEIVYRGFGVVVEVEGDHHRVSRAQWNRDIEKYASYAAEGWEVVRLTSAHVRHSLRGVQIVRACLIRRGWRP
jgi:hypothetical protein